MPEEVTFLAELAGKNTSQKCLSIGHDGDTKIVFESSASELPKVISLVRFTGQTLVVTVRVDD